MINKLAKKATSILITLIATFSLCLPALAATSTEPLEVAFKKFKFTTSDYNKGSVTLEYIENALEEKAIIRDKTSNEILETMTVQKPATRAVGPYIFKRPSSYGKTTVQLSVNVELYTKGSFRQINSYQGSFLGISSSVAPTVIEDKNVDVWSKTGDYPTDALYYAYNGTLVAEVMSGTPANVSDELLDSGFEVSTETESSTFYRRAFDSTGTISLYN